MNRLLLASTLVGLVISCKTTSSSLSSDDLENPNGGQSSAGRGESENPNATQDFHFSCRQELTRNRIDFLTIHVTPKLVSNSIRYEVRLVNSVGKRSENPGGSVGNEEPTPTPVVKFDVTLMGKHERNETVIQFDKGGFLRWEYNNDQTKADIFYDLPSGGPFPYYTGCSTEVPETARTAETAVSEIASAELSPCAQENALVCPTGSFDGCLVPGLTKGHICVLDSDRRSSSPCEQENSKSCGDGFEEACLMSPRASDFHICVLPR
jgi:hypothetical protein